MNKTMTATQARKNFYSVLKAAKRPGGSVMITHKGLPEVVVMSFDEFEGWMETFDIMSDPDPSLAKDIREGIKEMKSGKRPKNVVSLDTLKKKYSA